MNEPETVIEGTSALQTIPSRDVTPQDQPIAFRMLEMAAARGAAMAELEKWMDLADRWQAGEARKAFVKAMSAFKAETIHVVKDKANLQYGSRYISLGNLVQTVTPVLSRHGLHFNWDQDQQSHPGQVRIIGTVTHEAGHSESTVFIAPPDGSGSKNPLQMIKSTITYGRAVVFEALLGLAATDANTDDDGNGAGRRQDSATPADFDLQAEITRIEAAKSVPELVKVFNDAYAIASKAKDRTAMDSLLRSQKLRQEQLKPAGKKEPK